MHDAGGFSPPALSALRKSFLQSLSATRHSGRLSIFLLIHFRRHCHDSIQRPHSRKPATKQQRYRTILFLLFHLIFPTTHSFIISYFLCIFSRHRFAFPSLHIHHTPCIISSTCVEQPIPIDTPPNRPVLFSFSPSLAICSRISNRTLPHLHLDDQPGLSYGFSYLIACLFYTWLLSLA